MKESRKLGFGVMTPVSFSSEEDLLGNNRWPYSCWPPCLTLNNIAVGWAMDCLSQLSRVEGQNASGEKLIV